MVKYKGKVVMNTQFVSKDTYSDGRRKKIGIREGPSGNFMLGKGIFF